MPPSWTAPPAWATLLRWDRPGHGRVLPERFMRVAEETGLISATGAWVLHEACRTAALWPNSLAMAVNVSTLQFRLQHFRDTVVEALAESGLAPSRLELEITEGMLLSDTRETLVILNGLRALGVRLAMDDFGTGYASLGYLQKFQFDTIKIDLSFIRRLATDPTAAAIVRAVLALSKTLGATTIAEGVETRTQAKMLRLDGCELAQGYLFGRPVAADAFTRLSRGSTLRLAADHGGEAHRTDAASSQVAGACAGRPRVQPVGQPGPRSIPASRPGQARPGHRVGRTPIGALISAAGTPD